ncbi:DUF2188 domain-containing protein [Cupriavidus sp. 2TAF22]|uniref:DUF2188 domain-containing protein n=1 Tax=unclassified Cupriavidus TaxID=2640874 RepID=UPI003F8EF800
MRRDLIVCASRAGWIVKLSGTRNGILEFERQEDAIVVATSLAVRKGVELLLEDGNGTHRLPRNAEPFSKDTKASSA